MSKKSKLRRIAAFLAAACMVVTAGACGGENKPAEESVEATETAAATTTAPTDITTTTTTTAPKVTTTTTTTPPPLPVMTDSAPVDSWGQFKALDGSKLDISSYDSEEKYHEVISALEALGHDPETYDEYHSINENMIGWVNVYIPNETDISEPVVQYTDNKYFLTHDFLYRVVKEGAIFADFKCQFTTRTRPANTILYGHNMASGKSFAKITRYCPWYAVGHPTTSSNSLNQYTTSPTVTFDTIWEKGTYKVFAAIFVNTEEKNGEVFKYYKQRNIANEGEFYDYLGQIMDRSLFYTDVDLKYGDELLTLSTCYYPLGKANADTRFVVFARRVRDGESEEVDTSKAYLNPDPLYFDYVYKLYGGSWGGRNWDTSKIEGFDEYYEKHEANTAQ